MKKSLKQDLHLIYFVPREVLTFFLFLSTTLKWVDQTGLLPLRRAMHSLDAGTESGLERNRLRIQDRELQEISDDGWCLSMHQPWASLLVRGIKR